MRLHTILEGPWPHTTWFGRCVGTALDTFFWALTISWSWLLARVWSGPKHPFGIVWEFTLTYSRAHWNSQWSRITLCASNVYVWQISIDVQLQIQSVTWHFQKQKWMYVNWHLHFLLQCHLNVTCFVVRVISISKVLINVWFFSSQVTLRVEIQIVRVNWRAIYFCATFCVSNAKNLQKLCQKYTFLQM